jgi:division/cell wall cluster transcriptional repressor MraZ
VGAFVSSFLHALDPKKRLTIPSEWRDRVGMPSSLYVLPGLHGDQCLYVFPAREIARRLEKFGSIGIGDKKARSFARIFAAQSALIPEWDTQGRIRIKDELLAYARLVDQVQMVGALDHFELWNPELWKSAAVLDAATMEDALRYIGL